MRRGRTEPDGVGLRPRDKDKGKSAERAVRSGAVEWAAEGRQAVDEAGAQAGRIGGGGP